jgi:hemin uptake protein HemP
MIDPDELRTGSDERPRPEVESAESGAGPVPRTLRAEEIFGGAKSVILEHDGREYVLLITRHGRLLLNKRT